MRKIISIILAILIVASWSVTSFAESNITFTASNCEVFAGEEFNVDVFINDNSLLKSAVLEVYYNSKNLQFLDLEIGFIVENSNAITYQNITNNSANSYIKIAYNDSSASLSSGGKFVSIKFVAKDEAVGNNDIKLVANGGTFTSANGTVTPILKNGKVNVINNVTVTHTTYTTLPEESTSETNSSIELENSATVTEITYTETVTATEEDSNKLESKKNTTTIIIVLAILVAIAVVYFYTSNSNSKKKRRKKRRKTTNRRRWGN